MWQKQLKELVIFLGRLTHIANAYPCADGSKLRDSDAVRIKRRPKQTGTIGKSQLKSARARPGKKVSAVVSKHVHGNCVSTAGRWVTEPPWCRSSFGSTKRKSQLAKARAAFDASLDESFFESWREDRAQLLKPSSGPSASARIDAMRQRISVRSAASSS